MSELRPHFVVGHWQVGRGAGTASFGPVLVDERVRVDATGFDLGAAIQASTTVPLALAPAAAS